MSLTPGSSTKSSALCTYFPLLVLSIKAQPSGLLKVYSVHTALILLLALPVVHKETPGTHSPCNILYMIFNSHSYLSSIHYTHLDLSLGLVFLSNGGYFLKNRSLSH